MDLGGRLKQHRLRLGLTQGQLAAPAYTAAYVSTIEAGRRHPSQKALAHFASVLGIGPDQLATGRSPEDRARLLREYSEARKALASGDAQAIPQTRKKLKAVSKEARGLGLVDIEAKAVFGLALASELASDLEDALTQYEEASRLLEKESPLLRVDIVAGRARVLQIKGDVAHAAFLLERALAELREEGLEDPSALVRLHSSLVAAYFEKGLIDQAGRSAEIALSLAPEVSDPERLANMNLNVAILLSEQGRWSEGEAHFTEADRWFEQLSFQTDMAKVRLARAIYLREQERWGEARDHVNKAREVFQAAGQPQNEARAIGVLAMIERLSGDPEQAKFLLRQSISLAGADSATAGIAYRELALCESDRKKALGHMRDALRLLESGGDARDLAITYRELGNLLSDDQTLLAACEAYRKAADLFEQAA